MDFEARDTDDQQDFRGVVRAWLGQHVPVELHGLGHEHHESDDVYRMRRTLGRELGAKGWLYPMGPAEYGGGGLDLDSALVLIDEMHCYGLFLPPYYDSGGSLGSVAILAWGTDEQKRAFLPPIYAGAQRTWQLLTEPGAGSDLAAAATVAVHDGDEWIITGQKIFVGSAHGCEAMWTIVRTGPAEDRHHNLSWFMIPADAPGITVTPLELMGGSEKNMIFLEGVRVPELNLVGGENRGWDVATTHLDLEHGLRTDHLIGRRLSLLFDDLVTRCAEKGVDNAPLVRDERVEGLLAEAYVKKEVVRLLGIRNFWLAMADKPRSYEGAQAYYLEKKTSQWFAAMVLDILGPYALFGEGSAEASAIAGIHAAAIAGMHGGGTAEIQKLVMARRIGVGRARAEPSGRLS